jgi:hypothetical protein
MQFGKLLNAYKTKWRVARKDRAWERSTRRREIDAERDLPPRPLTSHERELLYWTLEHGSEETKSFLPQVASIQAIRSCTCGCPSIQLYVTEAAPLGISHSGRVIVDLVGKTPNGELVGVLVFQDAGKLRELEFYLLDGEEKEFGLPTIASLSPFESGKSPAPTHP